MERLIDADELLKAMDTWDKFGYSTRYGLERLDKDDKDFVPYVHYGDMLKAVNGMPTVEAISKTDYENRLKADMVAILTELQLEIEESEPLCNECDYAIDDCTSKAKVNNLIQQKIDLLQKQTTDNCDNCFNGTTKGVCAVKELMKNKDCKYYMPRKINVLRGEEDGTN